ncbi:MAG: PQQ-dependent sugar dehydrogenase, partial [Pirellulales bacterium]
MANHSLSLSAFVPLLTLAAIASLATAAHAVLLAEETFLTSASPTGSEYSLGNLAGQNPTATGFTGAWFTSSNTTSPTVNAASLNYSDANFPAETGGKLMSPGSNSRIHRLLDTSNPFQSTDSGTVYMSLLLQTGIDDGYRAFEMHNGGTADGANRKLQIGLSSFGDFPTNSSSIPQQFGFRVNNSSAFDFNLGAEDVNVHLFLVKFVLSTTNNADTITVWNNPSLASLASDPAGGVTATGFNFVADRLGAARFNGTDYGFDELRIGTTLQDVVTDFLFCDVNGNGVCNSSDIAIISQNMYLAGDFLHGDVDNNGIINFADYRLFKDHPARVVGFDAPGGGGVTIPEPATMLLAGAIWLCCWEVGARRARPVRTKSMRILLALLVMLGMTLGDSRVALAAAEDLLNDNLTFSGVTLNMRPYVTLPTGFNDIISMTTRPGDTQLYVTTQEGSIFAVQESGDGSTTPVTWFNLSSAVQAATGRTVFGGDGHDGLQSTAFHPDFENVGAPGYGKLYTTFMENAAPSPTGHHYLGNTTGGGAESVLTEWTYDHNTGQVDPLSYRELFRVKLPVQDHKIKQARFNPYAAPGDEDYGLLYLTHGDSSSQQSTEDRPQRLDNPLGKMLRINPLQSGADTYSIPAGNPFAASGDPNVLKEVYAYGFRNPHNFSFNEDDAGNVHILVGDIGRNNIEEVNLVVNGGNYGWTEREGTFVHKQGSNFGVDAGYIVGVTNLAANEDDIGLDALGNRYTYPVAQYDHNGPTVNIGDDYVSVAIASGFVIRNGSDPALDNQFIFNNFGGNVGNVGGAPYHTDFDAMLNAVTQLDANNPARDDPNELTQATVQRLHLALDHDNNPNTAPQMFDDLNNLVGSNRNDARYGEGVSGEMYISNKVNNTVYLVTNSVANNKLTLTVDRGTGAMTLTNSTGQDVDADNLSVFSPSGSLEPGEFQSLGGDWTVSPANSARALNQANTLGSLTFNGASSEPLGNAYDAQLIAFGQPAGEDLQFLFSTAGPNGRNFAGNVVYTGVSTVPNTIVL